MLRRAYLNFLLAFVGPFYTSLTAGEAQKNHSNVIEKVDFAGAESKVQNLKAAFEALPAGAVIPRRIFLFGDSLSDHSNTQKNTQGLLPPQLLYWQGRFTNGPNWADFVREVLDVEFHNFAHAGARALGANNFYVLPTFLRHYWVEDVEGQLFQFRENGFIPNPDDLFVIWIGGNDHLLFPGWTEQKKITAKIKGLIESLDHLGARKFVVMNLPDVSLSPFHALGIARILGPREEISRIVSRHNEELHQAVGQVRARRPELDVVEVDIEKHIGRIMAKPDAFGFRNIKYPCIGGQLIPGGFEQKLFDFKAIPQGICPEPEKYFFWDPWHPSTKAHCLTAVEFLDRYFLEAQDNSLAVSGDFSAVERSLKRRSLEQACL